MLLNGSESEPMGAVQIWHNGGWYLVCEGGLNLMAVSVICNHYENGYQYGISFGDSAFGPMTNTDSFISHVNCNSNSTSLADCHYDTLGTCHSHEYTSVKCANEPFDTGLSMNICP